MAVTAIPLQPAHRFRLLPPGVTGLHLPALFEAAGVSMEGEAGESVTLTLSRLARLFLHPPERFVLQWHFLDDIRCLWVDGGGAAAVDAEVLAAATGMPVLIGQGGAFAGEEGGLAMLEELNCHGMVCDLGQSWFKLSWAGRRWCFPRDQKLLPVCQGPSEHSLEERRAQRRALRQFIAGHVRTVVAEGGAGAPEGVVVALPSVLDRWGQPAGSSYIGMTMDTQLLPEALSLAGFPDMPHWVVNDAELAAASAIFDERVIRHGRALVFTAGTAIGAAVADPLAAAAAFLAPPAGAR